MERKITEALRYLGCRKNQYDDQTVQLTIKLMEELEKVCSPRYTYEVFDILINETIIDFGVFKIDSLSLSKNLKNCSKCAVFASTLGTEADFLIRRYSKTSVTNSTIINACANSLIEEYCDQYQAEIEAKSGGKTRARFSPGYGDLALEYQTDLVRVLNPAKKIGLTLSDSLILMPTKSVTALIGIAELDDKLAQKSGCAICNKNTTCEYKKG